MNFTQLPKEIKNISVNINKNLITSELEMFGEEKFNG